MTFIENDNMVSVTNSTQWYAWGPQHLQYRLCGTCWQYWKKYGGLKVLFFILSLLNVPTLLMKIRPCPRSSIVASIYQIFGHFVFK